ncbi:peptidase domain-containing ABC transporter [Pararhodospirillum oryzae]|uniref:ABC export transporter fused inner membrane and ATPases n=1 Tax=Pararhodospirillum oryzae TaxID=478448 RepID=A0A512H7X6_9PROT|nr:peptidase domain-containing ABC transporter [Pararhodospirillum oryzae]GEO81528.1 ABC export transporter fused inner membrane and ATPases [Pararhodospirillum oryzae]
MTEPDGALPFVPTALIALGYCASKHGVDLSVPDMVHTHGLGSVEPSAPLLVRIAAEQGFRARWKTLETSDLPQLKTHYPVIARLNNGRHVVLVGVRPVPGEEDGMEIGVLDPLASRPEILTLSRARFEGAWSGAVLMLRPKATLEAARRRFDLAWFLPEIRRQHQHFRDVALASVLIHLFALAMPLFFQLVIDKVLVHQVESTLISLTIGVMIAITFDSVLSFLRRYLLLFATNKIDMRVAEHTFSHLLRLPIDFFERSNAGVLVKHMQQAEKIRNFLTGNLFLTALDCLSLFIFIPIMLMYSNGLTVLVLCFTGITATIIYFMIGPLRRRLTALYQAEGSRQSLLVEAISGMRTIKSLALEPVQRRLWEERSAETVNQNYALGKLSAAAEELTQWMQKALAVAIIAFGAYQVFQGDLTIGALIAFQMVAGRVSQPLQRLVGLVHVYQETALATRMLGEIMNAPPERERDQRGLRMPLQGAIEFDRVRFAYPGSERPILDDLSFKAPAGSIFGIVGRSGSGKTTITRLMQGMYTARGGVVRIDGQDCREIDLQHLRSSIGVVLQDSFIFKGTVRENIALGKPAATFEEISQAAQMAGAAEFIERLPRGFDTLLEENGSNLSGGQKQRLAIARALVRQPRILILDEATSALDPESEALIQDNLKRIARGRTLIVISHRLMSLVEADTILVLEEGVRVGLGRHEALLRDCPIYATLWHQQMRTPLGPEAGS